MKDIQGSYSEIFADPHHWAEHRVTIGDAVYGMESIVRLKTPGQLFDTGSPGIGSAVSREMELEFLPGDNTIPTSAKCVVETRIAATDEDTGETTWSTWIPMGTFFIDSRTYDETGDVLKIHCYDTMLKTEYVYLDKHLDQDNAESWPMSARTVFQNIAGDIGATGIMGIIQRIPATWRISYPGNSTARDILRQIAVAMGGNFIIDDYGNLACPELNQSATVAQDLGLNVGSLSRGVDSASFTRVRITGITGVDGVTEYTAGDDTGLTIEGECPWGTQAIADSVLAKVNGWVYRPFTASEALLEPAVELGDTVQINGWKSIVAKLDRTFDKMCDATLSAPDDEELNHEFPYVYTGYKGNHELKQVEQEIARVDTDVKGVSADLEDFKSSVASMSSKRTVKLDFASFDSGTFTETLENSDDPTITYDVDFDGSGRPVKLTCSDGHTMDIIW